MKSDRQVIPGPARSRGSRVRSPVRAFGSVRTDVPRSLVPHELAELGILIADDVILRMFAGDAFDEFGFHNPTFDEPCLDIGGLAGDLVSHHPGPAEFPLEPHADGLTIADRESRVPQRIPA